MIKNFKSLISKGFRAAKPLATPLAAGFHSSQAYNKKLNFGESFVVLEDKISKISQLVYSFFCPFLRPLVEQHPRVRYRYFNR